ncbi:uncharacterized protein LOC121379611 [Gigantopelta aegis]|uniref:uncharacterized protein LOC121379611 n=1 Tax=Gigantopelta aegis TaxID=1735272 RepID=UPI001B88D97D|nr:uncharacterized protein LOC121379611 [Gigantopelta aegis]
MLLHLLVILSLQIATCSAACNAKLHPITPRKYFDVNNMEQTCQLGFIFSPTSCYCTLVDQCYGPNRLPEGFRFKIPGSGLTCYTFIKCVGGNTIYAHCTSGYKFEFHKGCVHGSGCVYDANTLQHSTQLDIFYPNATSLMPIIETYGTDNNNQGGGNYNNLEPHVPGGSYGPCQYQRSGHKFAPKDSSCFEYNVCQRKRSTRSRCPSGYSFNANMNGCMYDSSCFYHEGYNMSSLCVGKKDYMMLPYGSYCNAYVVCFHGHSYYGRCPDYYRFREGEGCVADRYCVAYRDQTGICTADMEASTYSYREYCYEYYVCYGSMSHYERCPDGFSYHYQEGCIEDHYCRYEQNIQKVKDPCSSVRNGAKYSIGGYCNEFYVCRHQLSIYQRCPNGYAFEGYDCVKKPYCKYRKPGEYPLHKRKKRALDMFGYDRTPPVAYMDFCYERPDGYTYNIGGFCYEYYTCNKRMSYYSTCPDRFRYMAFSSDMPARRNADYYYSMNSTDMPSGCVRDDNCRQYPNDLTAFDFCAGKADNFTYTLGGYCNEYFQCHYGKSVFQKCPEGFSYSDKKSKCIYDDHCKSMKPGHYLPDPCKNLVNGQAYHNGGYCYEYFECWNKTSFYEQCPSGYKFDGIACTHDPGCYYEHHVKSDYCVGSPDGYSFAGGYCYEFNQCYKGMSFYKRCPEGYSYDSSSGDCKHDYGDDCEYNHHKLQDYCYNQANGHTYERNGHCYEYYVCHYGKSFYHRCPIGYSYKYGQGCIYDGECYYFHFYYQYYFYYYYYYYGGDAQINDVLTGPYGDGNMTDPYGNHGMNDPYGNNDPYGKNDPYGNNDPYGGNGKNDPYGGNNNGNPSGGGGGHYASTTASPDFNYGAATTDMYSGRRKRAINEDESHDIQKRSAYEKHDFCSNSPDGYTYNLGGHCYEYFTCMYGRSYYSRCPNLHKYDAKKGCVYDHYCKITHDNPDNACVNAPNFYTLSYGGHCFEYYFCYNNKSMYERCPWGHAYHQHSGCIKDKHCTYKLNLPFDNCEHHPDGYKFSYGGHCYEYQQCFHSRSYYERCPDGHRFNGETCIYDGQCTYLAKHRFYGDTKHAHKDFCRDKKDNFKYSFGTYYGPPRRRHVSYDRGTTPGEGGGLDMCYNKPDGYTYSKGGYCYEYYVCDGTQSYYERCPGGHKYDAYKGRCVKDTDCYHEGVIGQTVDMCKWYKSGESFSRNGYCNEFFVCSQGKPLYQRCANKYRYEYGTGCVKDEHCFHRTPILGKFNKYRYEYGTGCVKDEHCFHRTPILGKFNKYRYEYETGCVKDEHCFHRTPILGKFNKYRYEYGTGCVKDEHCFHRTPILGKFNKYRYEFETGCVKDEHCFHRTPILGKFNKYRYEFETGCVKDEHCFHRTPILGKFNKYRNEYGTGCVKDEHCFHRTPILGKFNKYRYEYGTGCVKDEHCFHRTPILGKFNKYRYEYGTGCVKDEHCFHRTPILGKFNKYRYEYGTGCVKDEHCFHRTPILEHCRYNEDGFRYTVSEHCWEYYECYGGKSYYYECPDGFRFDMYQDKCVRDTQCKSHHYITQDFCQNRPDYSRFSYGTHCYDYFECINGNTYYERCPSGTAFDGSGCVNEFRCDLFENLISPASYKTMDVCKTSPDFSAYKRHGYCHDYEICINGVSHFERCPIGFSFVDSQGCSFDQFCSYHVQQHQAGHNGHCTFEKNYLMFRTTGYCWEYNVCYGGRAYTQRCPVGYAFKKGQCLPDTKCYHKYLTHYGIHYHGVTKRSADVSEIEHERVERAARTTNQKTPNGLTAININYCKGKEDGYTYSIGGYCYEYFRCYGGKPKYMTCPVGFAYKQGKGCVYDGYCYHREIVENDFCHYASSGTKYSYGGYCGDYFVCHGLYSVYERCPNYYRFDGTECVHDERCHFYTPHYAFHDCENQYDGFRFKYKGYCYEYYECQNGTAFYQVCPFGYSFDGRTCSADTTCYPQPTSSRATDYCADKSDGSVYSKGGFCDEYYTCSYKKSVFTRCPAGTGYHGYRGCLPDASCKNRRKAPLNDPCMYLGEGTSYSLGEPCYEYFVCINWMSERRKCPSGRSYNFISQQCVMDSKCKQTGVKAVCYGAHNGYQYAADNCYGYYVCGDGKPTYERCAKGYKFDGGSCRYDFTRQCIQY